MNYADAQLNCQEKFGNIGGKLFEPRLYSTNQLVYAEAVNFISGIEDDFLLGINDLATEGQYVYASDGQEVVDGMWKSDHPKYPHKRCVGYLDLAAQGYLDLAAQYDAGWVDRHCDYAKEFSICQVLTSEGKEGMIQSHYI